MLDSGRALMIRSAITALRRLNETSAWIERLCRDRLPAGTQMTVALPTSRRNVSVKLNGALRTTVYVDGLLGYEGETTKTWVALTRKADYVFDIGAHQGVFSLLAADANLTSRVFAFEPVPENYEILEGNIASSGFNGRV